MLPRYHPHSAQCAALSRCNGRGPPEIGPGLTGEPTAVPAGRLQPAASPLLRGEMCGIFPISAILQRIL